eukprot:TRINITY_DN25162_c0_g2_i1.p2 TRINITY_DN25162_c0_g2~~TRINITY_DN25162_c0_g2_i1.p2  ORF type:complete len:265 (+),score=47.89 TRINITY_DN25162_c0_g2_i1:149-943(+)
MGQGIFGLVFQPPPSTYPKDPNLTWLRTRVNEDIPAFYLRREGAKFTLLFSHGNAEDLGLIVGYFRDMSLTHNVNVFAYEYTGYGNSSGQPREVAVYADVEAAFKYVRDQLGVPWEEIIPYGRSIGTAPSIHLASITAVRGIILQSPMASIFRIPFQFRFTLPGDVFCNIDKIDDVCCPVFIIHGTKDEIVPCWHGEALYERCRKKGTNYDAYIVEGADHNNLEVQAQDGFQDHFRKFLQFLEHSPITDSLRRQAATSVLRDQR